MPRLIVKDDGYVTSVIYDDTVTLTDLPSGMSVVEVDNIPEPILDGTKGHIMKYENGQISYEYYDIPPTMDAQIQQLQERITLMQQALDDLLLGGM
jgi:hypothetical protein